MLNEAYFGEIIVTAAVLLCLITLRFFLVKMIKRRSPILDKAQRRWINRINNSTLVLGFTILVFIWAPQLHTFALSLTAVAVAIVITTKEILMCLTGGFLRAAMKPFMIGHWIAIDDMTGEVMSINALGTVIQEIDTETKTYQFTGRTIEIPNSRFLTASIRNLNFFKNYLYHDITITVQHDNIDFDLLIKKLEEIVSFNFTPHEKGALAFNKIVEKKSAVDFADPSPQYFIKTSDLGHYTFTIKLFLPTLEAVKVDTEVKKQFLSYVYQFRNAHREDNKAE